MFSLLSISIIYVKPRTTYEEGRKYLRIEIYWRIIIMNVLSVSINHTIARKAHPEKLRKVQRD